MAWSEETLFCRPDVLQAQSVEQVKTSYSEYKLTQEHADVFSRMAEEGDVFGRLSRSIAPEIFGMEDVKKVREPEAAGGI